MKIDEVGQAANDLIAFANELRNRNKRAGARDVEDRIVNCGFNDVQSKILRELFGAGATAVLKNFVLSAMTGDLEKKFPGLQEYILGKRIVVAK